MVFGGFVYYLLTIPSIVYVVVLFWHKLYLSDTHISYINIVYLYTNTNCTGKTCSNLNRSCLCRCFDKSQTTEKPHACAWGFSLVVSEQSSPTDPYSQTYVLTVPLVNLVNESNDVSSVVVGWKCVPGLIWSRVICLIKLEACELQTSCSTSCSSIEGYSDSNCFGVSFCNLE